MRKFALLGHPLGHTMSPAIHSRLFELSGQTGEYDILSVPPEKLAETFPYLKSLSGFNVTIPYKVDIMSLTGDLDETARRYGAVNVVDCRGPITGYNTDCVGFLQSVRQAKADLARPVCVMGAGGVGRMFAIECALQGAPVTIAVLPRHLPLAETVRESILALRPQAAVRCVTLDSLSGDFELLINATPSGMFPHVDEMPVEKAVLSRCRVVFDAVYNPTRTLLLKSAAAAGCETVGGMAMLVWQAVAAHEIWDGVSYPREAIDGLIEEMTREVDRRF
ncbi:MAG: shikimate dehydrogenase [Oscillospiraceae bacterium]|nr:shikimate dehydrogenase [Oscillospiraceae bacterium]